MSLPFEWMQKEPDFPWLAADDCAVTEDFMRARGWLDAAEHVESCARAGEGNMNLTMRVITPTRTVILKQARPWVEKYAFIPAPWDRATHEARFYARVARIDGVANRMPRLIASDESSKSLLLEDLAPAADRSDAYSGASLDASDVRALAHYLRALHHASQGDPDPRLENRAMRALNHEHMFNVPIAGTGAVDLDSLEPGLGDAAAALRGDAEHCAATRELGARYLANGQCLLHGDFFPGSWLGTQDGIRVIDPEFCFYGDPEFDLGIAIAHFRMTQSPASAASQFLDAYGLPHDARLVACYAAIEVVRRIIGLAQLPIPPGTTFRRTLLRAARATLKTQDGHTLWS